MGRGVEEDLRGDQARRDAALQRQRCGMQAALVPLVSEKLYSRAPNKVQNH